MKRQAAAMWLTELKGMTPIKCCTLFKSLEAIEDVLDYTVHDLNRFLEGHFYDRSIDFIDEGTYKKHLDDFEVYLARAQDLLPDQHILMPDHPYYPKQLLNMPDFPIVLYCKSHWLRKEVDFVGLQKGRGTKNMEQAPQNKVEKGGIPDYCIGIVGARRCSLYAKDASFKLAKDLAGEGFGIISGLAFGVDVSAHQGALKAGGFTIGVLGGGLDTCYPPSHQKVFDEISEKGMLVSEEWFGKETMPYMFPKRNRIISGISHGVVVVEAAKKSGSLITVDFALEQGRDVYAVSGRILDPKAYGSNQLIRQGAKPVFCAEDIANEYRKTSEISPIQPSQSEKKLEEKEKIVYSCISYEPVHEIEIMNQITRMIETGTGESEVSIESSMHQEDVTIILLVLELKGLIRKISGCYYARSED